VKTHEKQITKKIVLEQASLQNDFFTIKNFDLLNKYANFVTHLRAFAHLQ